MIYQTAWLRVWKFLDEKQDVDSAFEICKNSDMSYTSVLKGLETLESIGLVNIRPNGKNKDIRMTQKFFSTRKTFSEVYEAVCR